MNDCRWAMLGRCAAYCYLMGGLIAHQFIRESTWWLAWSLPAIGITANIVAEYLSLNERRTK
jgi:hypothetical protein